MGSNPCREKTRWVDVFLTRLTVAINDPGKRRYAPADLLMRIVEHRRTSDNAIAVAEEFQGLMDPYPPPVEHPKSRTWDRITKRQVWRPLVASESLACTGQP